MYKGVYIIRINFISSSIVMEDHQNVLQIFHHPTTNNQLIFHPQINCGISIP